MKYRAHQSFVNVLIHVYYIWLAEMQHLYLVVALKEVVEVVPLANCVASGIQTMTAVLLEVVLPPCHHSPHTLCTLWTNIQSFHVCSVTKGSQTCVDWLLIPLTHNVSEPTNNIWVRVCPPAHAKQTKDLQIQVLLTLEHAIQAGRLAQEIWSLTPQVNP